MKLTPKTKIMELIKAHGFLLEFLAAYAPEFEKLKSPIMRNTVGRFATVEMAAAMASMPVDELLRDIEAEITRQGGEVRVEAEAAPETEPERLEVLKGIIADLHAGVPLNELKERFSRLLEDVSAPEIAEMEQQLIADGLPEEEVKQLCDVHVEVFRSSLEEHDAVDAPPGHPIDTFQAENRALRDATAKLQSLLDGLVGAEGDRLGERAEALTGALDEVAEVEVHYQRKENQLFPYLERKGVTAPPQVMWAIHDDVRAMIKALRGAIAADDAGRAKTVGPELVRTVNDMAYKEEKVLYPMCYELLSEDEWIEIRQGEGDIGYALVEPRADWPKRKTAPVGRESETGLPGLALDTGLLTADQINLMLKHLPVDLTFVDENDQVRYFSDTRERIFPRSPAVIGRKVQLCHPAKSVHIVNRIVQAFRDGDKDVAEFWIELGGRFIHIRYFPVRDAQGSYRGTLEVSQDVTGIRALEGQRRLLDWEEGGGQ